MVIGSSGKTVYASMRLSFINVPLLLPRSSISQWPNGSWKILACFRETSLLSRTTSHRGLRPMIVLFASSSTCQVLPRPDIVNVTAAISNSLSCYGVCTLLACCVVSLKVEFQLIAKHIESLPVSIGFS